MTVSVSLLTYVDGVVGRSSPRMADACEAAGPSGSTHRSTIATKGSSLSVTVGARWANFSLQPCSGLVAVRVSAIAACSFGIDEDGAGDLDGDQRAVHGDVQGVADAGIGRP